MLKIKNSALVIPVIIFALTSCTKNPAPISQNAVQEIDVIKRDTFYAYGTDTITLESDYQIYDTTCPANFSIIYPNDSTITVNGWFYTINSGTPFLIAHSFTCAAKRNPDNVYFIVQQNASYSSCRISLKDNILKVIINKTTGNCTSRSSTICSFAGSY